MILLLELLGLGKQSLTSSNSSKRSIVDRETFQTFGGKIYVSSLVSSSQHSIEKNEEKNIATHAIEPVEYGKSRQLQQPSNGLTLQRW